MKSDQHEPKNFDKDIDAALNWLNKTQAPVAMLSRVHRGLETAAADVHRTGLRKLFWIPVTGCVIAVILLVVFNPLHQAKEKKMSVTEMARTTASPLVAVEPTISSPARTSGESSQKRSSSSRTIARHNRQADSHDRHAANLLSYPLTQQERLLLQFAQTADPKDLQALNPEHQAAVEAEEKAQFAAYLKPRSVSGLTETLN